MRLFIAVDISKEAEEELKRVQKELLDNSVKFTKTNEFHLTLKFLGEVDEEKIKVIREALQKVKITPFNLNLSNIGTFPSDKFMRVVWVGIEGSDELIELHNKIQDKLKPFNFKDEFDYKPHLTLARIKSIEDKQEFQKKLEETKVKEIEFESKSFFLYKSTLTQEGSVYEKVGEFS